ncbi:MAG: carbohydrate kinase family protein [Nocardioidaceae bacterium]
MAEQRHDARALVVGESLVDLTRRPDGTESVRAGGSPLNIAVGLSRLEVTTTLASQVGDDEYGELLRGHVDASDVDLRSLPPHHGETATAVAEIDAAGVATYGFELEWDPSELPTPDGFDLVHVGSIGAVLPPGADAIAALAADVHARGIAVSIDPNVRPAITPDLDEVRRRFAAVAGLAQVCKLSDEDARVLYPGASPDSVAEQILALGPVRLVALTLGDAGSMLASAGAVVRVPAVRTTVVDTIGAGDSYMAALLAGLAHQGWLSRATYTEEELSWLGEAAGAAAALTCSRAGADPPYLRELPHLDAIYTRQ